MLYSIDAKTGQSSWGCEKKFSSYGTRDRFCKSESVVWEYTPGESRGIMHAPSEVAGGLNIGTLTCLGRAFLHETSSLRVIGLVVFHKDLRIMHLVHAPHSHMTQYIHMSVTIKLRLFISHILFHNRDNAKLIKKKS